MAPVGALACLAAAALGGGLMLIGADTSSPTQAGLMTQPAPPAPRAAPQPVAPQLQVVPRPALVEPAVVPSPRRAAVPVALRRSENLGTPGRARQQAGDQTHPDRAAHAPSVDKGADKRTTENNAEKGSKKKRGNNGKNGKSDNKGENGTGRGKNY